MGNTLHDGVRKHLKETDTAPSRLQTCWYSCGWAWHGSAGTYIVSGVLADS